MSRLDAFLDGCRTYSGGRPHPGLADATGVLLRAAHTEPTLLVDAAGHLSSLPPHGASWVAVTLGSGVEGGADAEATGPALFAHLDAWLVELADLDEPTPRQAELLDALPFTCQAVVAHLARWPARRAELGQDARFVGRLSDLEGHSFAASWVREAVERRSAPLVVLHPESGRGLQLRYDNVASCFHLFSLIQLTVGTRLPGGRTPSEEVAAVARGVDGRCSDEAWWHFGDPRSPDANIGGSIWGEANVAAIPAYDGVQVVLLWPPVLGSRSWDSGFYGPHLEALPATMTLERELTADEVTSWLQRLHP